MELSEAVNTSFEKRWWYEYQAPGHEKGQVAHSSANCKQCWESRLKMYILLGRGSSPWPGRNSKSET